MNKFKVGDIIKAIDNRYVTSIDNEWVGIVIKVNDDFISVKTIYCKNKSYFNYHGLYYEHFKLLNKSEYEKYHVNNFAKKHFQDFINEYEALFKNFDIKFEITEKAQILDEKEKEYLSAVIKPFRDKVKYIQKLDSVYDSFEIILIEVKSVAIKDSTELINLPYFKQNTMYKGMETNKTYTLEELGL